MVRRDSGRQGPDGGRGKNGVARDGVGKAGQRILYVCRKTAVVIDKPAVGAMVTAGLTT